MLYIIVDVRLTGANWLPKLLPAPFVEVPAITSGHASWMAAEMTIICYSTPLGYHGSRCYCGQVSSMVYDTPKSSLCIKKKLVTIVSFLVNCDRCIQRGSAKAICNSHHTRITRIPSRRACNI